MDTHKAHSLFFECNVPYMDVTPLKYFPIEGCLDCLQFSNTVNNTLDFWFKMTERVHEFFFPSSQDPIEMILKE